MYFKGEFAIELERYLHCFLFLYQEKVIAFFGGMRYNTYEKRINLNCFFKTFLLKSKTRAKKMNYFFLLLAYLSPEDSEYAQEIFESYYKLAYSILFKKLNNDIETAEALSYFAETVVNSVDKMRRMDEKQRKNFIYSGIKYALKKHLRFRAKDISGLNEELLEDRSTVNAMEFTEFENEYYEIINKLPPECKLVVEGVFINGLSYANVAKNLGISTTSAYRYKKMIDKEIAKKRKKEKT